MSVKVTTIIKQILRDRAAEITSSVDSVHDLLEEVRKQILAELATGTASGYSTHHMRQALNSIESYLADFESAADRELAAGIKTTFDAGAGLLPSALDAAGESGVYFGMGHISSTLIDALQEFTFGRIRSVTGDLYTRIKGELTLGILGQKSPQEIAAVLAGNLADVPMPKNRWGGPVFSSAAERAQVITETELGRAFSMATAKSIGQASDTVSGLQGMWLHAGHPKQPRMQHLAMHGEIRPTGKPFFKADDGTPVMYPRDPNAPIKESIRCGCILIPYSAGWGSQQSWAETFMTAQDKAAQGSEA